MRKLTNEERALLETLYNDSELIGRGNIRKFLIANTYEPKYKIGDFVMITDTSTTLHGNRAVNIKTKIEEIRYWLNDKGKETITYCGTAKDQHGNTYFMCAEESIHGKPTERHITARCTDNLNEIEIKSKHKQATNF